MSEQTFHLPDLGEGLTEAEIVKWHVGIGDEVAVDATIVEVETAKSLVEVPSPYAGVVSRLHVEEGATVDVGRPLITIGTADSADGAGERYREEEQAGSGNVLIGYGTPEPATAGRRRRPKTTAGPADEEQSTTADEPQSDEPQSDEPQAEEERATEAIRVVSPIVRRLARENGVALASLRGSGEAGLIVRRDVEDAMGRQHADKPLAVSANGVDARTGLAISSRTPMSPMRRAATETLSRSRSEIPEATVWVDVDATRLIELRESFRSASDPGPGLLAILARFVVAGLGKYPELNGRIDTDSGEILQFDGVNLGLAIQSDRGLVAPAVCGAETKPMRDLDRDIRALTERARQGKASTFELSAGTFTLNNYGSFGVDGSAAIINHPQVAILGLGRIIDRPWVVEGQVVIRKLTQMSFVFDHRVCDGGVASGFMRFVADAIENPMTFLAEV